MEKQADVNQKRSDGTTAIMGACKNGHSKIVELLLEAKAEIGVTRVDGTSEILLACRGGYFDIVKTLIKQAVNVTYTTF